MRMMISLNKSVNFIEPRISLYMLLLVTFSPVDILLQWLHWLPIEYYINFMLANGFCVACSKTCTRIAWEPLQLLWISDMVTQWVTAAHNTHSVSGLALSVLAWLEMFWCLLPVRKGSHWSCKVLIFGDTKVRPWKVLKLDVGPEKVLIFDHKGAEKLISLVHRLWCSS